MKNIILFLILIAFSATTAFAQLPTPKEIKERNSSYYIDGNLSSRDQVYDIMDNHPSTHDLVRKSTRQKIWGWVSLSGGLLLTASVVDETYKNYMNRGSAYGSSTGGGIYFIIGGAFLLGIIGIGQIAASSDTFDRAIKRYNKEMANQSTGRDIDIDFHLGLTGAGVTVRF